LCELLAWLVFWMGFSWGFVFLSSLIMLALLCSAHIFQHYKKLFCTSSQIKCAPTAWLIKLLRLNGSFIPVNMDTDFSETQTCFSHNMQSVLITTNVVGSNPAHGYMYSIQYYVIKFVSDLWQVCGFLRVLRFPPPIKLTATI
jgi:hypothetical protein